MQTYQKTLLKHRVRPVSSRITSQCTFKVTWPFVVLFNFPFYPVRFHVPIENNRNSSKIEIYLNCYAYFMDDERYCCFSHRVQCRICYIDSCLNQQGIRRVVFYFLIRQVILRWYSLDVTIFKNISLVCKSNCNR